MSEIIKLIISDNILENISKIIFSSSLIVYVIGQIVKGVKNLIVNRKLRSLVIKELKDTIKIIDKNIQSINKKAGKDVMCYFLQKNVIGSLLNSNKILIFNKSTRNKLLDINSGIEACNVLFNDLADNKYKYAIGLHSQMMKIYEKKLIKMKMKIEGLFQPGKGLKNKLLISRKLKNNICQKNPLSKF